MSKFKYVLLGNSAAAVYAAEAIRSIDNSGSLAIVSAEDTLPYSPALTTYFISGTIPKDKIYFRQNDFYKSNKITTFLGKPAIEINRKNKTVKLVDGSSLQYEKLLISTGGQPQKPDLEGIDLEGVFTLRTLADAEAIKKRAAKSKTAVILGGGLVGLRGAYCLHQLGLDVTIVVGSKHILSQNLDSHAAAMMEEWLREKHFKILTKTEVESIEEQRSRRSSLRGMESPRPAGSGQAWQSLTLRLTNGKSLPADIVIIGKGVSPNAGFAKAAGIKIERGIVVNNFMQTSDSNIYAAGDVAQAYDKLLKKKVVNAIWPAATEQGRIAGINMAGGSEEYEGSMLMNSVDFYGLSALSIGITNPGRPEDFEIMTRAQAAKHTYRKLVLKKDVLVGAVLIGDIDRAGIITGLINEGVKVSGFKESLYKDKFGFMVMPKEFRAAKIAAK